MSKGIIKICITGPESTGKTTLAKALSEKHDLLWTPEMAREYLTNLQRPYGFEDLLAIAKLQLSEEEKTQQLAQQKGKRAIICDTGMLVLFVWSEDKFAKVDAELVEMYNEVEYTHYLLCYPDIPWEDDGLREDKGRRHELFEVYEQKLQAKGVEYSVVKGSRKERLQIAEEVLKLARVKVL